MNNITRRTNPRSSYSEARITCGANECFNLALYSCPECKLEVCKKHFGHSDKYDKPIMAHSNIRRI